MADLKKLEEIVWQSRERIIRQWDDGREAVTLSAYDAVTTLLMAVIEELHGVRRALENGPQPDC